MRRTQVFHVRLKNIILLEDDRPSSRLMAKFLTKGGYSVTECSAVDIALRKMPDLLIADILLPEKHGSEAVWELKNTSNGKDLKVSCNCQAY